MKICGFVFLLVLEIILAHLYVRSLPTARNRGHVHGHTACVVTGMRTAFRARSDVVCAVLIVGNPS